MLLSREESFQLFFSSVAKQKKIFTVLFKFITKVLNEADKRFWQANCKSKFVITF